MPGPLSRYSTQQINVEDIGAVVEALSSPWLTQGPAIERFEDALAGFVGAEYAVAVNSGTAALHLAVLASDRNLFKTSPLTFVATANAVLLAGGGVEFADVDPVTGNVDDWPEDDRGAALIPVHYSGRPAPIPESAAFVIEDAAHALGSALSDGTRVGCCAHSQATCFSFHPVKPITTGEGGAVTTNDQSFAQEIRSLRNHGRQRDGLMYRLGLNYRMDELSAALGISQLKRCEEYRLRRLEIAQAYDHAFRDMAELLYHPPLDSLSANHIFPVRVRHGLRDATKRALLAEGIGVQVHYVPVHEQPYYVAHYNFEVEDFPYASAWGREELSLPCHAGMTRGDVATVLAALDRALVGAV